MNLSNAVAIEPYMDDAGRIGFVIGDDSGEIRCIPWAEWTAKDAFQGDDLKYLEKLERQCLRWQVPPEFDCKQFILELRDTGGYKDGPDIDAFQQETRNRILRDILRRLEWYFRKFICLEDDRDYYLLANFVISSYFRNQFAVSPHIAVKSVTGTGKTTVLKVLEPVIYRGWMVSDYTKSTIARHVDGMNVSLLLDEFGDRLEDKDNGHGVYGIIKAAFDRKGVYSCTNKLTMEVDVFHVYTSCVLNSRGGDLPEDLVNRCINITLGLPDTDVQLEQVTYMDDIDWNPPEINPDAIRADLYALKVITDTARATRGTNDLVGIDFADLRKNTGRLLKTKAEDGRYLYALVYQGRVKSCQIANRDFDLAMLYLTIGQATGTDEMMISRIIDNQAEIREQAANSDESVIFNAFLNTIRTDWGNGLGTPITMQDIVAVANKTTMGDIQDEYRRLRSLEGYTRFKDPRTLTALFKNQGFGTREGGGRVRYVDAYRPGFEETFKRGLKKYADFDNRAYYGHLVSRTAIPENERRNRTQSNENARKRVKSLDKEMGLHPMYWHIPRKCNK